MHPRFPLLLVLAARFPLDRMEITSRRPSSVHVQRHWESCGTTAERLADIYPGLPGSEPRELVDGDGVLFFTADDGVHGRELSLSSAPAAPAPSL